MPNKKKSKKNTEDGYFQPGLPLTWGEKPEKEDFAEETVSQEKMTSEESLESTESEDPPKMIRNEEETIIEENIGEKAGSPFKLILKQNREKVIPSQADQEENIEIASPKLILQKDHEDIAPEIPENSEENVNPSSKLILKQDKNEENIETASPKLILQKDHEEIASEIPENSEENIDASSSKLILKQDKNEENIETSSPKLILQKDHEEMTSGIPENSEENVNSSSKLILKRDKNEKKSKKKTSSPFKLTLQHDNSEEISSPEVSGINSEIVPEKPVKLLRDAKTFSAISQEEEKTLRSVVIVNEFSSSIGEILQEARISKGYGVEEVAMRTKIKEDYLYYLEEEKFDQLPAPVYTLSYLRQLCREYELPIDEITKLFEKQIGLTHLDAEEDSKTQIVKLTRETDDALSAGSSAFTSWSVGGLVAFVLLILFASSIFSLFKSNGKTVEKKMQTTEIHEVNIDFEQFRLPVYLESQELKIPKSSTGN